MERKGLLGFACNHIGFSITPSRRAVFGDAQHYVAS
jgi:hypothetical protein